MKTRAELDAELNELAAWVPEMLGETDEPSQIDAFACRAQLIECHAGPDDAGYVSNRIAKILVDNCMVPAEEGPCA